MPGVSVSVSLSRSSQRLITSLARLMSAIEHADPAMLEDEIKYAHLEVKAALQEPRPLAFEEEH